jgi:hypothetical protein
MAAAVKTVIRAREVPGNRCWGILDLTPNSSYPALGEPVTAADFGLISIDTVITTDVSQTTALHAKYDPTNKTIRLYTSSTGAEVATASDQSASKYRLVALGV